MQITKARQDIYLRFLKLIIAKKGVNKIHPALIILPENAFRFA
jgi:hypothetical protein